MDTSHFDQPDQIQSATESSPKAGEVEYALLKSLAVDGFGHLKGSFEYRIKTFTLIGRPPDLFMLASECARVLELPNSSKLFQWNPSLSKDKMSRKEKKQLFALGIFSQHHLNASSLIVTARAVVLQFGSVVVRYSGPTQDSDLDERPNAGVDQQQLDIPINGQNTQAGIAPKTASNQGPLSISMGEDSGSYSNTHVNQFTYNQTIEHNDTMIQDQPQQQHYEWGTPQMYCPQDSIPAHLIIRSQPETLWYLPEDEIGGDWFHF